ncbi:MAG: iron ABC transporter substrate-binding protein [Haloechinothrix sp.]
MPRSMFRRLSASAVVAAMLFPALAACGTDTGATDNGADTLVIYSGRSEELVGGILDRLEEATGATVEVRYGDSAQMAAQLLEEGERTDADLFFSQDAGALGALSESGRLEQLQQGALDVAPEKFRADDGTWVATSARARVVVYDHEQVSSDELPSTVDDLVDPKWKGKVGYAPTNASWQAFVTGLRVLKGEDGAREWLTAFKANDPQVFEKNGAILNAVDDGQVPLGLINHYYHFAKVQEEGADKVNAKLHYVGGDDPLALVNVAGVGVIKGSDASDAANKAVEFLLSETAQQYFADETAEYPVREGVQSTKHELPPLSDIQSPDIDLTTLSSLEETLKLLQEVGLS